MLFCRKLIRPIVTQWLDIWLSIESSFKWILFHGNQSRISEISLSESHTKTSTSHMNFGLIYKVMALVILMLVNIKWWACWRISTSKEQFRWFLFCNRINRKNNQAIGNKIQLFRSYTYGYHQGILITRIINQSFTAANVPKSFKLAAY